MFGPTLPASRFVMACALGLYSTASGRMLKATLADYAAAEQALLVRFLTQLNVDGLLIVVSRRMAVCLVPEAATALSGPYL